MRAEQNKIMVWYPWGLGVSTTAPIPDILQYYKKMALQQHPDMNLTTDNNHKTSLKKLLLLIRTHDCDTENLVDHIVPDLLCDFLEAWFKLHLYCHCRNQQVCRYCARR